MHKAIILRKKSPLKNVFGLQKSEKRMQTLGYNGTHTVVIEYKIHNVLQLFAKYLTNLDTLK